MSQQSLFSDSGSKSSVPLAARMRPQTLDEIVGQDHILGPGKPLRQMLDKGNISSVILWGPPGTGKTTVAQLLAIAADAEFRLLSAVTDGVPDLRKVVAEAQQLRRTGQRLVLAVDEIHRWSKAQQAALLPHVENGLLTLIGVTSENPYWDVIPPLRSRLRLFKFEPLGPDDIRLILQRALGDQHRGTADLNVTADDEALNLLVSLSAGDGRVALTALEGAAQLAAGSGSAVITAEIVSEAVQRRQVRYDKDADDHYQTISAFIKSVRGSDPDAAVFWLAKMVEAGEDVRFICRRLMILASEDIGNADPRGIMVAVAAADACERVGLPEAGLIMSQATIYLATAPKSNASAKALWSAQDAIRSGANTEVPLHLRNASFSGAKEMGYGVNYKYSHDFKGHYVTQQYLPDGVKKTFYAPTSEGYEKNIAERMRQKNNSDK